MHNYKKISTLGRGFYGTVILVQNKKTKHVRSTFSLLTFKMFAMKKIFLKDNSELNPETSEMNEIEVLKSLTHPNIIKYHDTFK